MGISLDDSFRYCRRLAQRTGRNFYFSFLTLPQPLLKDMCALYAFMRVTDDLGDDVSCPPEQRRNALQEWRGELEGALAGGEVSHPVLPALVDVQQRHQIPLDHLQAVITGVEMDLDPQGFDTFEDLGWYCDHVAGAVGLCCIHVWGFRDPAAADSALDCGRAFQLTNILRDLGEDARMGRTYLPREDLEQFGYTPDDLRNEVRDERFRDLMTFEVIRAREYYRRALVLHQQLEPPGRPILSAMLQIYGGLLQQIERCDFDVFSRRIKLSLPRKSLIALRCLLQPDQPPEPV